MTSGHVAPSFQPSYDPGPSKEEIVNKRVATRPCATTPVKSGQSTHPIRRPERHSVKGDMTLQAEKN